MNRPIPHHTYRGYRLYGCRQECCRRAASRYSKAIRVGTAQGTWRPWADKELLAQHLHALLSRGWTLSALYERTGHETRTLPASLADPDRRIRAAVARGVLAVSLDELPPLVPVYRVSRRLRALAAQGWGATTLARLSGLGESALCDIRAEKDRTVTRAIAQVVLDLYEQLRHEQAQGPCAARVRARAARQGWRSDIEWDGLIDLPEPELAAEVERQLDLWDPEDLAAARTAHRKHGERSLLIVAASLKHDRELAAARAAETEHTHA